jgi:uncharacterized protein with HEPN domain
MKTDQSAFLHHILDAIKKIEKYIRDIDEEFFMKDDLIQDGVIRQIEIIGEAVKRLSNNLKNQPPNLPWQDIAGMRDPSFSHSGRLRHLFTDLELGTRQLRCSRIP